LGLCFVISRDAYSDHCQKCTLLRSTIEGFCVDRIKVYCQIEKWDECPGNKEENDHA